MNEIFRNNNKSWFRDIDVSTLIILTITFIFFLTTACSEKVNKKQPLTDTDPVDCQNITRKNADDCIRLNQIQVLGTHNSYRLAPAPELIELLDTEKPGWAENLQYSHRPIEEQLEELGIRQFEFDIFADPEGSAYAEPAGALLTNDKDFIREPEMMEPGFKVIHVLDIDYRTTCFTLKSCMRKIRDWSVRNPAHLPILILIEVKNDPPRQDWGPVSFTTPVQTDDSLIYEIDKEIWEVFSKEHVITPDEIRGDFQSLEEAILKNGWPTLAQSRGRVLFALDNTDEHRDAYLSQSPGLEDRAMFTSSEPGEPAAAFIKMNNSINDHNLIKERIAAGYVIRTRSDIPVHEAKTGDTTRRQAALTSGAQYISTDYPEPSPFGSGYIVTLPDAESPGRCNPVSAPPSCRNIFITE